MPRNLIGSLVLLVTGLSIMPALSATYYLDNAGGNDVNSGTSSNAAWQSLSKASTTTFRPGDRLLLKAGGTWTGELDLNGDGTLANPIVVDQYGTGAKPLINGGGNESAVRLQGISYWEVNNLELINNGGPTQSGATNYRVGVLVKTTFSAIRNHLYLRNLTIHDIYPETGPEGHGIHVIATGSSSVNTYFDDVRIENCQISLTGHYGIWVQHTGSASSNPGYQFNQNIVIRNNTFSNTGGSGVETGYCDGVLLENNVVNRSGASVDPRQWARGSGYWPFQCRNVLVQSNEFRHARGEADSCGMHIDYGCSNVLVQYNLSLDNEGGFVEILGGCVNSTYRYNVSINDGSRIKGVNGASQDGHLIWVSDYYGGSITRGSTNSMIYNNTVYVGPGVTNDFLIVAKSVNTFIQNNVFYLAGKTTYTNAGSNTVLQNNLWQGALPAGVPFGPGAVFANPLLANAGGTNAADYLLSPVSPAIAAGVLVTNNGSQDFWGNLVPAGAPCIGANERSFATNVVISINLTASTNSNQQIGPGQIYGVASQNSVAGGWINLNQTLTFQNLPLSEGWPSTVSMTGTAPAGWNSCNPAYHNTPLLGGIVDYTGTAIPTTVTLSNLSGTFPNGCKLIAYLSGFNSNTGAAISNDAASYYYQTLNDPSNEFSGTLTQTITTDDLGNGNAPFAQYAAFGMLAALTNDTLTLTLRARYGGGALLGGFQILSPSTVTPHGVPYVWFLEHQLPIDDVADADADGQSAWQEYYAGTDPTNATSAFKVIEVHQSGPSLSITWLGGTNGFPGNWSMSVSSNLIDWTMLVSKSIPRNSSGTNTWTHTNGIAAANPLFYRPCVEYAQ